jgi:ribosomal protein S18 acetylase RimI-like enzyme
VLEPAPLATDSAAVHRLLREALGATAVPGERPDEGLPVLDGLVNTGAAMGRLFLRSGRPVGLALWEPPTPVGLFVHVLYFEPSSANREAYRSAMAAIKSAAGPVSFVLRTLAGLSTKDETELMHSLGFAPYGRSEMRYPESRPPPNVERPDRVTFRPPNEHDKPALADLHLRAYAGGLDRYLFLSDPDPRRDSEVHIAEVTGGRHGPFLPAASVVAEANGQVFGACLVVRAAYGPLIVDVMVDPTHQRRGLARAMVAASVRALRASAESVIALNVTEGNIAAVRAYEHVGFVRTIGPQWSWFARSRIAVEPGRF